MLVFDLVQAIIHAQATCSPGEMCTISCLDQNAMCPASAFNPIAAAFATEGYWVQDHLIHYLVDTGMGLWAPLIYIIAAIGGLVGLAVGAPPRMYMWFFMGPAIYAWLLDTRELASGVEWRVGDMPQDQREVWKLAEPGLKNSATFYDNDWIHRNLPITKSKPPGAPLPNPNARYAAPGSYANVATFFLWFDELISDTVQQMTLWVGAWDQFDNVAAGRDTNLSPKPAVADVNKNKWFLMSNSKWEILTNITDAKLHSAELRDAFVTFLSSECGDLLKESIDSGRFIALANAKGQNIDSNSTVMKKPTTDTAPHPYNLVTQNLMNQTIPTPRSVVKLLSYNTRGSFREFANLLGAGGVFGAGNVGAWGLRDRIACDQYLYLLIHGFRWEAGHTMNQLVAAGPNNMLPSGIVWTLLYGWDLGDNTSFVGPPPPWSPVYFDGQVYLLENLILVHMFRNEMAMAPAITDQRYNTSEKSLNFTLAYQRSVGQKSKWAEVYTWAMMIPYLQGVLLYLLSIAYPFACIVILMPGMHKAILTWMSFWAWVKLWDLGFAICVVLERSVWGMVGNNSNAARLLGLIKDMAQWGVVRIDCTGAGSGLPAGPGVGIIPTGGVNTKACPLPSIFHVASNGAVRDIQTSTSWIDALRIFDRSLVLGANLDFDLANSYYIYIMAALYFAVPTVTGQLVLGARAGAAGMVNSALGGVAQEAGKMAGSGHGSEAVTQMSANMGSVGQAAYAKSLRQSGLGMQAIEYGNQSARESDAAGAMGTKSGLIGNAINNKALGVQSASIAGDVAERYIGAAQGTYNKSVDYARSAQAAGAGGSNGSGTAPTPKASSPAPKAPGMTSGEQGPGGINKQGSLRDGDRDPSPGVDSVRTNPEAMQGSGPALDSTGQGAAALLGQAANGAAGDRARQVGGSAATAGGPWKESAAGWLGAGIRDLVGNMQQDSLAFNANGTAAQADLSVGSYGAGTRAKGYEMAAGRMSQHAGFEAQQSEWEAKNAFANQISGQAVAMGHFVGGMNAGNKPTGSAEAMAMSGMLNTKQHDAKGAAFWSDPVKGQRFGNIEATQAQLGRFGGDFAASQFQQTKVGAFGGGFTSRSGGEVRQDASNPFRGSQTSGLVAANSR